MLKATFPFALRLSPHRLLQVTVAKNLPPNQSLPFCNLIVKIDGVQVETMPTGSSTTSTTIAPLKWAIDSISYGVQDLVYTRVFAMIVVKDEQIRNENPFDVHAFVCDSRAMARRLTYALAASFQEYSRRVKEAEEVNMSSNNNNVTIDSPFKRKFAIDLRTPEELQDASHETEAWRRRSVELKSNWITYFSGFTRRGRWEKFFQSPGSFPDALVL